MRLPRWLVGPPPPMVSNGTVAVAILLACSAGFALALAIGSGRTWTMFAVVAYALGVGSVIGFTVTRDVMRRALADLGIRLAQGPFAATGIDMAVFTEPLPSDVSAVEALLPCRCEPAWRDRNLHAPDCLEVLHGEVLELITTARNQGRQGRVGEST